MYMKCSVVATKISDIIDHEAGIMKQLRFYSHLMMCSKCREYFSQFKLLKKAATEPDPNELPKDFDSVMSFVMDEIENKPENESLT